MGFERTTEWMDRLLVLILQAVLAYHPPQSPPAAEVRYDLENDTEKDKESLRLKPPTVGAQLLVSCAVFLQPSVAAISKVSGARPEC